MKSPHTGKEMELYKEERSFSFRKEKFNIVYHYFRCSDSNESFTSTEIDDLNLVQLYNQYRSKNKIPFPNEIRQLREQYGVSAAKMSEILGFGPNGYRNYESGEVPNLSNSKLIQLVKDAREFKKLLLLCTSFDEKAVNKILARVDSIIKEQKENRTEATIKEYLIGPASADNYTGFRLPDLEKFTEMIVFFTEKLKPYKTKMNKLLFYADFVMYERTGFSMSGMRYVAINMGPVPDKFNTIYDFMARQDDFKIVSHLFADGGIGEKFTPNPKHNFNATLFSSDELSVLSEVEKKFRKYTTQKIIDISHKEKGWIMNKDTNGIIDYKYGFDISF